MVRLEGVEPPAHGLEVRCSIQLSYRRINMERVEGIEPSRSAWKAEVLPLNYTRTFCINSYRLYQLAPIMSIRFSPFSQVSFLQSLKGFSSLVPSYNIINSCVVQVLFLYFLSTSFIFVKAIAR